MNVFKQCFDVVLHSAVTMKPLNSEITHALEKEFLKAKSHSGYDLKASQEPVFILGVNITFKMMYPPQ